MCLLTLAWSWIAVSVVLVGHFTFRKDNGHEVAVSQQSLTQQHELDSLSSHSPLLIFTCQRAEYLQATLTDVLRYLPEDCSIACPIILSQDGTDASVTKVIQQFQSQHSDVPILHWQHSLPRLRRGKLNPYQALAVHYGWALRQVFSLPSTERVLILEEDLHISPDFFAYFARMAPLLDRDRTLLAVSAFNDNGLTSQVKDATRVVRSDFFPGLGWCMTRRLWDEELSAKWPQGYWDDWLREPAQRQGRHILRPEVRITFETFVSCSIMDASFIVLCVYIHIVDITNLSLWNSRWG
jgi:alpha-1,3-mannosyl-glycoprotein beta-1,2-N-acetylglucosaminyltransferase